MKKIFMKIALLIMVVSLACSIPMIVSAYSSAKLPNEPRVYDKIEALSDKTEQTLDSRIEKISEKYQIDIVIVLTNEPIGQYGVVDDADLFSERFGYTGNSAEDSVVCFYVNLYARDWVISTMGLGQEYLTDYACDYIGGKCAQYLSNADYTGACNTFLDYLEEFFEEAKKGKPFDYNHQYRSNLAKRITAIVIFTVLTLIGMAVAGIRNAIKLANMNTINSVFNARGYIKVPLELTIKEDRFLRTHTSRTLRSTSSSSSGGRSGGSSSHTSSSGHSHGGSHGKF